jgi:hypothetical protein
MSIKGIAASALTAAFLVGSMAVSDAQTNTSTGGRTTTAPKQGTTAPSAGTGAQKGAVDCPGNAENSKGRATQHNPNCVKTNTRR